MLSSSPPGCRWVLLAASKIYREPISSDSCFLIHSALGIILLDLISRCLSHVFENSSHEGAYGVLRILDPLDLKIDSVMVISFWRFISAFKVNLAALHAKNISSRLASLCDRWLIVASSAACAGVGLQNSRAASSSGRICCSAGTCSSSIGFRTPERRRSANLVGYRRIFTWCLTIGGSSAELLGRDDAR